MAIDNFIPEIWDTRLLRILEPNLVLAQPSIVNHDYEGDIKAAGDTVHIREFTVGGEIYDYTRGQKINGGTPDRPDDDATTLTVDQQKSFYIAVDDVDEAQSDITIMDKFLARTARNLANALDIFAASKFVAGALAANTVGTVAAPKTIKVDGSGDFTPYQFCVEARRLLKKQDVPFTDPWMVINADLEAAFLNDPQFIQGGGGIADASVVRNGTLGGKIAGFNILVTEAIPSAGRLLDTDGDGADDDNVETGDHVTVVFGDSNYSHTWADQIIKTEAERLQGEFGDAIKGLQVFGSKIVENESYGIAHLDPNGA